VGSSKRINLEFPIKAIPVDKRRLYPPDKFFANSFVFSLKFKSDIILSTSSFINSGSDPLNLANNSKCSFTVKSSYNISNYGQTPIIFLISFIYSSTSYPNIFALPFVKLNNPVNIEIVVVFPIFLIYIFNKILLLH